MTPRRAEPPKPGTGSCRGGWPPPRASLSQLPGAPPSVGSPNRRPIPAKSSTKRACSRQVRLPCGAADRLGVWSRVELLGLSRLRWRRRRGLILELTLVGRGASMAAFVGVIYERGRGHETKFLHARRRGGGAVGDCGRVDCADRRPGREARRTTSFFTRARTFPRPLRRRSSRPGGTLAYSYGQIGVAIATSSNASFVSNLLKADKSVDSASTTTASRPGWGTPRRTGRRRATS